MCFIQPLANSMNYIIVSTLLHTTCLLLLPENKPRLLKTFYDTTFHVALLKTNVVINNNKSDLNVKGITFVVI